MKYVESAAISGATYKTKFLLKDEPMAHEVSFDIPERLLGRADIAFTVKQNGSVLGTLTVSNGSVVWFPKGTTYGC